MQKDQETEVKYKDGESSDNVVIEHFTEWFPFYCM